MAADAFNSKKKEKTMIDAREELVSSASSKSSPRRTAATLPGRAVKPGAPKKGLKLERVFSQARVRPFDELEWDRRTAEITDDGGKVIFKQENVEVPKSWSVLATKVVVSKYLRRTKY